MNIAKIMRVLTVPPFLVILVVTVLWKTTSVFITVWDAVPVVLFLAVIPLLAYLLQPFIPYFFQKGRSGQRALAIIVSCVGYTAGAVTGYISGVGREIQLIYNTYLLSVIVLTLFNCFHVRVSGHACSVSGPLVFLCYYGHIAFILPCILIACCVIWSSLTLKRHTARDLIAGASVSVLSFFIMNMIM